MMMKGLWKLTWVEFKVFLREPMGSVITFLMPAALFILVGRSLRNASSQDYDMSEWINTSLPVFLTIFIAINAVTSLTTIMSIYREGGILKRLKATPLRPHTILTAHVLVKLFITGVNMATLILVGKSFLGIGVQGSLPSFLLAAAISTVSILSLGFVIASFVPTARFAQLVTAVCLYPLLGVSGLFAPVDSFPIGLKVIAYASPLTHAVSLTTGMWEGDSWSHYGPELVALTVAFVFCMALSSKVFRWE